MYTPSLPYRRLVKFANGIWDENRKTFYPFKVSNATVAAKRGIRYFVSSMAVSGQVSGISAASSVTIGITQFGTTSNVLWLRLPATTQASDYVSDSISVIYDVLLDENAAIACATTATSGSYTIVYAEIPVDGSGVPVVVQ